MVGVWPAQQSTTKRPTEYGRQQQRHSHRRHLHHIMFSFVPQSIGFLYPPIFVKFRDILILLCFSQLTHATNRSFYGKRLKPIQFVQEHSLKEAFKKSSKKSLTEKFNTY